jgi:ABC-type Mn2+/Zn2+ transport system permease subunit
VTELLDALALGAVQNALLATSLLGATCAVLGVYVVTRRMAFFGDALAHSTLPGIAVAYLVGVQLVLGAAAAAVVAAVLIGLASRRKAVTEDTAIGVVFTGMFALGVLVLTGTRTKRDPMELLFGTVLGVTAFDLWVIAGVFVVIVGCLVLVHKEMELTSYDPTHAAAVGLNPDRLRLLLLVLLALAVVAGVQSVGVLLTNAMLVTPAATALLVTRRLVPAMLTAVGLAVTSAVGGLVLSCLLNASSMAAVVLVATGLFALVAVARPART